MSELEPPNGKECPLPKAWNRNPFAAPAAHVADARTSNNGTLAAEPNRVATGRGLAWWSEGWQLFRLSTGWWIGLCVVPMLINTVVGPPVGPFQEVGVLMISLLGPLRAVIGALVIFLLYPVFIAGLMLGCRNLESGKALTFGHLLAGFQNNFGRLLGIGVRFFFGVVAISIIIGGGAMLIIEATETKAVERFGNLLFGLLGILLVISVWFASALVALHDLTASEAMKLSLRACLRNLLPLLIYGLAFIALGVLASLPWAFGWLLLLPVAVCSLYASYRDLFTGEH
jgi:hypothetical protein